MSGIGVAGLMLPFGRAIAAEALVVPMDLAKKKSLADAALAAATAAGASYCDVRIGRYLRQFVITREDKVQNVVNTESTGIGVRVLVNGAWGFAATNDLGTQGVVKAAQQAAAIAKANAKMQTAPVQLAKAPGVGEVSWKTPIRRTRWKCRSRTRSTCCWASMPRRSTPAAASSTRCCSWSTSRSTSPRPTAATSTRTCTASGRR
jgi:TldD protein